MAAACCCSKLTNRLFMLRSAHVKEFLTIRSPIFQAQAHFLSSIIPPKKPGNSFILFSNDNRSSLIAANPGTSLNILVKQLSEKWKALSQDEKDYYVKKAKILDAEYKDELREFESSLTEIELDTLKEEKKLRRKKRTKRKEKKILKMLEKPKRSRQAFAFYAMDRASDSHQYGMRFIKTVSEDWNAMSDDEKQVYRDKSKEDIHRYEVEMAEWEDRMIMEGHTEYVRKTTKQKLQKKTEKEHQEDEDDEDDFV